MTHPIYVVVNDTHLNKLKWWANQHLRHLQPENLIETFEVFVIQLRSQEITLSDDFELNFSTCYSYFFENGDNNHTGVDSILQKRKEHPFILFGDNNELEYSLIKKCIESVTKNNITLYFSKNIPERNREIKIETPQSPDTVLNGIFFKHTLNKWLKTPLMSMIFDLLNLHVDLDNDSGGFFSFLGIAYPKVPKEFLLSGLIGADIMPDLDNILYGKHFTNVMELNENGIKLKQALPAFLQEALLDLSRCVHSNHKDFIVHLNAFEDKLYCYKPHVETHEVPIQL